MRQIRYLAALLLTVVAVSPAHAIDIEEVISPGGIKAWLVQDDTADLVSMSFSFRGGALMDREGREGTANLLASTLDEGAGDLDSNAFRQRLEDQSISISFNAGTETFAGSFTTLNRYRDEAVDLLKLALSDPRFDSNAVERIRGQILVGLNRKISDPQTIAGKTLYAALFGDHPYSRSSDGTIEGIKAVTVADLRDYMNRVLTKDKLMIGVVGNITPEELVPILDTVFGPLPETGEQVDIPSPQIGTGETIVVEQDIPQSITVFAQPALTRLDPDFYPAYILTHILGGGGFESRLMQEVREKRGLAYSAYAYLRDYDETGLLAGGVATRNDAVAESIAVVRQEWQNLKENGVDQAALDQAKAYLTGSYPLRFTSSGAIARILVGIQYYDFPIDYVDNRNAMVEAVTLEDVNRVAKSLLDPSALTVVVVGKPQDVTPTMEAPQLTF